MPEKRVKIAGALTAVEYRLGVQILHRQTERVKFHRT
jgi:hypothetical protein